MIQTFPSPLRWGSILVFVAVFGLWLIQTKTVHESWTESTRLASIQALVEHGTWRIDASPYGHETGDKMLLNGHYYSEKPPLFAAIGSIFYRILHQGLGATLAIDGCQANTICVYYWLTILLVGLPSAIMAALFYRFALSHTGQASWAAILTGLLCFGTLVWPYSLVFNHHLPAAIALFVAFYLLQRENIPFLWPTQVVAGGLVGLAVMLDLTSVFVAAALFFIVVIYHRRAMPLFVATALIPGLVTILFNYQITGGPLFAYFSPEGYDFPGSPWGDTVGGQNPPEQLWLYTFRSLVGDRGLLGYMPVLIFSIFGLGVLITNRRLFISPSTRIKGVIILCGILAHFLFVLTRTNHFGGDAYGWRFFIPIIPILYSFIVFAIPENFSWSKDSVFSVTLGVITLWSIFSSYRGVQATWHSIPPPVFFTPQEAIPYLALETDLSIPTYTQDDLLHEPKRPRNFEIPITYYSLDLNFNNDIRLLGYDITEQRLDPGEFVEITFYWQSLQVAKKDYFTFAHLLASDQTQLGSAEGRLLEGYPFVFWYPGEVVADHRQIKVSDDTQSGIAWLQVGGYELTSDQQINPMSIVDIPDQTAVSLGPFLIGPSPAVSEANPQNSVFHQWGQPSFIDLIGYDLDLAQQNLNLTLYWQSQKVTSVDYTIFVHVRDQAGEIVAQLDQPPLAGQYPTTLWQLGEIIPDRKVVLLPDTLPLADYTIFVGLYDGMNGERLYIEDTVDNSLNLTTITLN